MNFNSESHYDDDDEDIKLEDLKARNNFDLFLSKPSDEIVN
jgi:hypothetical protein